MYVKGLLNIKIFTFICFLHKFAEKDDMLLDTIKYHKK